MPNLFFMSDRIKFQSKLSEVKSFKLVPDRFSSFKANLDSRKAQSGIPENYVITKIDPIRAGFRE